jgi:hypothetical protein
LARDRDRQRAYFREYQRQHRAWKAALNRAWTQGLRAGMLAAYGGVCACCGEDREPFLTLDHSNRDGAEHRRSVGGSNSILVDLRNRGWPKDGYRILCMNCNWATRYGKECPHQWPV